MKEDKLEKKGLDEKCCINFNSEGIITHYGSYDVKPDCSKCDGYGVDAKKYGWKCYLSRLNWLKTNRNSQK